MPRYRLLQARKATEPVIEEERVSFAARLRVGVEDIEAFDLLRGETSLGAVTDGVDAVLVGGSGHFSIRDEVSWMPSFLSTLRDLADAQFPTFASCFGFQGLVVALGCPVIHEPRSSEVGTYTLSLTDEGRADPIFSTLPETFTAQMGHKDSATSLPEGAVHLARSERCPFQALRVGTRVYATQFHPELSGPENRQRFKRYLVEYSEVFGADRARHMLDHAFEPSEAASSLLRRFAEQIVPARTRG